MKLHFLFPLLTFSLLAEPGKEEGASIQNTLENASFAEQWAHLGPIESRPLPQRAEDGSSMSAFHTDFLQELGGESRARLLPGQSITLPSGEQLQVGSLQAYSRGWNRGSVGGRSLPGTCHYFYTELLVEEDELRYLYADFEGSPKVWINGELVLANWRDKHILSARDYGVQVQLKAGVNRCLVKVDSKQVWWLARLEFLDRAAYEREVIPSVKGLQLQRLRGKELLVQTQPATFRSEFPFSARIEDAEGKALATAQGNTGEPVELSLVSGEPLPSGRVYALQLHSEEIEGELPRSFALQGESSEALEQLRRSWPQAKEQAAALPKPWPQIYAAASGWVERLLASPALENSAAALESLSYVQQLCDGLRQGKNPLEEMKGLRIPVWFNWQDEAGQDQVGNYGFRLPRSLGEANAAPRPLLYSLRGGSFRKVEVGVAFAGQTQEQARYEVDRENSLSSEWLDIIPANLDGNWGVEMLEAIHAHAGAHLPLDQDRVYVTGGSMGGMGGWNWIAGNPNRFAAAVLRSGLGDAFRAPRALHTPIWAICGGKDRLVINVERAVSQLQEAGGIIRYTLLPHNGHGGGPDKVSKEDQFVWMSKQVRSLPRGEAVDLRQHYGIDDQGQGALRVEELSAQSMLQLELNSPDLIWSRNLARAEYTLLRGYRLHGRMVTQPSELVLNGERPILRYPVDLRVDPSLLPEGVLQFERPAGKRLSRLCWLREDQLEEQIRLLREEAEGKGLQANGEISIRLIGNSRVSGEKLLDLHLWLPRP